MNYSSLFVLLFFISSCNAQSVNDTIKVFEKNRLIFDEIAIFVRNHIEDFDVTTQNAAFIDTFLVVNKNFKHLHKDKLIYFFNANLFDQINIYYPCNIEFRISFYSNKILNTETKKILLYTIDKELPLEYEHWSNKVRLDKNWWSLEYTDSQF